MHKLQIQLFGSPSLTIANEPVTGFVSSKAVALVYYLAATNRPHGRDSLATLFWADAPDARAKKNLRDVLSNLRRLIEPYIDITRQTAALRVEADTKEKPNAVPEEGQSTVDAVALERVLDALQHDTAPSAERTAKLEQALAFLQGEFLEGFYVQDAPLFEEWVLGERERYGRLLLQLLSDLVADCTQRGAHLDGINYAARRLALDPLEEETHRQLMTLYAATGQYAAALAQYERCCEILYAELGAEPTPETTELFDRIQAAQEQPSQPWPTEEEQTPFVGRRYELAEIQRLLAKSDCRLLTLAGLGGVGKTRLAYQVAKLSAPQFLDGVYFAELESATAADQLVETISDAVGLSLAAGEDAETQLLNFLQRKELLLVLDNSEVLVTQQERASGKQPVTLLTAITRAAPGVKLLVTSRERLNLRVEQLFEVTGLALPSDEEMVDGGRLSQTLMQHDAVQLFMQCVRRVWANMVPEDAMPSPPELHTIVRICGLVDGMPLAIELAAGWVHTLSYTEILHEIKQGIDLLETSMHDVPERHRSLRAVFDHSSQMLSLPEQTALKKLSIFRGGFTRRAAQEVAGATLPVLMNLVRHSFLQHTGTGYYTIHTLLRQYAEERLQESSDESAEIRERHCRFYAQLLQQQQEMLEAEKFAIFADALFPAMENIRTAYRWAIAQRRFDIVAPMIDSLYSLYLLRSWFQEGAERFQLGAMLARTEGLSKTTTSTTISIIAGKLAARWGIFCQNLGQYELAHEQLTFGLEVARQYEDAIESAFCLLGLANVALGQGAYAEAEMAAQESFTIYQEAEYVVEQTRALYCLGKIHLLQGESVSARQDLTVALSQAQVHDLRWTEAESVAALGEVCWNQGDYSGAHRYFVRAADLFQVPPMTNYLGVANALNKLGFVAWSQGDLAAAADYHEQACQTLRQLGNRQGEGNTLSHLGRVAERRQHFDEATLLYQQALTINQEIGDRHGEAISTCNLAFVAYRQGNFAVAMAEFVRSREICRQIHYRRYEAMALACVGLLDCLQGDYVQGETVIRQSLQIAQEIQDPTILGYCWAHLGYALVGSEEWADAALAYQNALDIRRNAGDEERVLDPLSGLAYVALRQGRMEEAQQYGIELLNYLDERRLASAILTLQIHFLVYCTSRMRQEPQAAEYLHTAHTLLQQQSRSIVDETERSRFLNNPVVHRQIIQAMQEEDNE